MALGAQCAPTAGMQPCWQCRYNSNCLFTEVVAVLQKWRNARLSPFFFFFFFSPSLCNSHLIYAPVGFQKGSLYKGRIHRTHCIYHGSPRKMTQLLRDWKWLKLEKCTGLVWSKVGLARPLRCQLVFPRLTSSRWDPAETCNQLMLEGNDNENTKG